MGGKIVALLRRQRRWFPDEAFYSDEKCARCGVCCGATDGDACEHLQRDGEGWYCEIYEDRLGPHHTVNGYPISCVPIRKVIESTGGYEGCAYVKEIARIRRQRGEPVDDLGRSKLPGDF